MTESQAAGSTMRYNMETGQVALTGAPGEPVPRVVNEQIQVDATNIDMNVEGSKMRAYGESRRVQSIMFPAKPGAKTHRAHARAHEAGSAGEWCQPRARVHGRREQFDRAHGHGHARAGGEKRNADQGRQDFDRRQDRESPRAGIRDLADARAGREPHDESEGDDALDGIRAADAVRRRRCAKSRTRPKRISSALREI